MQQILMVDDDVELCEMITEYLLPEGFTVTAVHDGEAAVQKAQEGNYSLLLLDVMLPRLNGFEVLRRLRAASAGASGASVPVLMLTARGHAVDRIVGLEIGADDYLPKPFDERELVARMRAILRRSQTGHTAQKTSRETLTVGDVVMDSGARTVSVGDNLVALTAAEFDLLALLLRGAGTVVERDYMAQEVLDRDLLPFDRSIDTHISHVRRKLGPYPGQAERIKTVRGVGYIYVLPTASASS
ncbi:MAG TPA: response regulator transcription factor [Abditibacteriaceae bacterium]|jgi:two-component system response regulator CpxR